MMILTSLARSALSCASLMRASHSDSPPRKRRGATRTACAVAVAAALPGGLPSRWEGPADHGVGLRHDTLPRLHVEAAKEERAWWIRGDSFERAWWIPARECMDIFRACVIVVSLLSSRTAPKESSVAIIASHFLRSAASSYQFRGLMSKIAIAFFIVLP